MNLKSFYITNKNQNIFDKNSFKFFYQIGEKHISANFDFKINTINKKQIMLKNILIIFS
jgi:hypothetical protein